MTDHKPLSEGEMKGVGWAIRNVDTGAVTISKAVQRREVAEANAKSASSNYSHYEPVELLVRATHKPLDGEAVDEKTLRHILAEEIKERGGPQEYIAMLGNRWMEIDSELPPELSAALAAMKRAAILARSTQKEATEEEPERLIREYLGAHPDAALGVIDMRRIWAEHGIRLVKVPHESD